MLSWQEFAEYAKELKISSEYVEQNREFFNKIDPDYFDKLLGLQELPEREIETAYPDGEYRRLIFILLVAKYPQMKKIYQERGYSMLHFEEVKQDISLWLDKSMADTKGKIAGIDFRLYNWESMIFAGETLQFGRLQCNRRHKFESKVGCFVNSAGEIEIRKVDGNCKDALFSFDDEAINIHIPASGKLLREDCLKSLKMMKEFFEQQAVDYKAVVCYSWILDPVFAEITPKSNLIEFQKLGHLYRMDGHDQTDEVAWRVFDIPEANIAEIEKIPCRSSMQKAVAAYLRNGGKFCEYGMIILRSELETLLKN